MAEKLKRDYDLIVLKTELLDTRGDEGSVRFTLQCKVEGKLTDVLQWTTTTAFVGLASRLDSRAALGRGPTFRLPQDMIETVGNWIQQETKGQRPLWVHLVRPYGALRLVPWERLLFDAVHVPILMLPDFIFPAPLETKDALEVALCGSAPLGHEEGSVYWALARSIERIRHASGRRTRVHVFTDRDIVNRLLTEIDWPAAAASSPTSEVVLHDHTLAEKYVNEDPSSRLLDRTGALRSPWLLWMREALRDRAIDVMHFVCHGYLARDRGAILFAQSPLERTDRYLAGPVGAPELQTLATQVGAWSTVFTALPDNYSDPGLRALADEIAQSRPGPLMMVSTADDPQFEATAAGYRFLYSAESEPPPRARALFVYCQPYRVLDAATRTGQAKSAAAVLERSTSAVARNTLQTKVAALARETSPLDSLFEPGHDVVPWVASTQRFAEQVQLRYQQLARDEVASTERCTHDTKVALETVDELRRAVAVHAVRQGGSDDGKPQ